MAASSAYEDDFEVNKPLTPQGDAQNIELGAVGGQVKSVQNAYDEDTATQADQNAPPPPPPYCMRVLAWFPLRYANWLGGIGLLAAVILDLIFSKQVQSSPHNSKRFLLFIT